MSKTNIIDSDLPLSLWAESVAHSVYVKNRIPHAFNKKTPFEIFFGMQPRIGHLQYFGQKAYVNVPTQKPESKLCSRAYKSYLIGFDKKEGTCNSQTNGCQTTRYKDCISQR